MVFHYCISTHDLSYPFIIHDWYAILLSVLMTGNSHHISFSCLVFILVSVFMIGLHTILSVLMTGMHSCIITAVLDWKAFLLVFRIHDRIPLRIEICHWSCQFYSFATIIYILISRHKCVFLCPKKSTHPNTE